MRLLLRRGTSGYVEADDALSITDSLACEADRAFRCSDCSRIIRPPPSPSSNMCRTRGGDTSGLPVPMGRFVARSRENANREDDD